MNQEPNRIFDVAVIGAGVCGSAIARQLCMHNLDTVLLEKEADVSFGTSKANSGIIHGGFHHPAGMLKSLLERDGALAFDRLHDELGFPFKRCGILVAAMHPDEMKTVEHLYRQGLENGAPGLELCSRDRMLFLEPKLSHEVVGGLFAPQGGIIEPYRFVFSLVEHAIANGLTLAVNFPVVSAVRENGGLAPHWRIRSAGGTEVRARYAVNAAGLFADSVSRSFGAEDFTIHARKGEYFLLDRLSPAIPDRVVFPVPSGVSKGMLVIPTVEGTCLLGPTAEAVEDKQDLSTSNEQLARIVSSARTLVPTVSERDVITSFAGLRPVLGDDFYIDLSKKAPSFVQVAGIQSPGLTASPAIASLVLDLLRSAGLECSRKKTVVPLAPRFRIRDIPPEKRQAFIEQDPLRGRIICRCEEVSEAEIVEAIHRGHTTLDGIKFYTRSQMGRCQGGFCSHKIIRIIMRETGMSYDCITKRGGKSRVLESELR